MSDERIQDLACCPAIIIVAGWLVSDVLVMMINRLGSVGRNMCVLRASHVVVFSIAGRRQNLFVLMSQQDIGSCVPNRSSFTFCLHYQEMLLFTVMKQMPTAYQHDVFTVS
eukprot:scaffold3910_cov182-Amphora_coffeaeformis.AAC.10